MKKLTVTEKGYEERLRAAMKQMDDDQKETLTRFAEFMAMYRLIMDPSTEKSA